MNQCHLIGKTRIIILQGAHDGTGFDGATPEQKIGDFIFEVEEWVNSKVQTKRIYTDSFATAYFVHCVDWTWTRSNNEPSRILCSFLFKETF